METNCNSRQWDNDMDFGFPVKIKRREIYGQGLIFESHWHEQLQILYFELGEAVIYCNSRVVQIQAGDLVILNSNDIHYGETPCQHLIYYIIKVDFSFLFSNQIDLCQTKYMSPLIQNQIYFQNHIAQDSELLRHVKQIIEEYTQQNIGYELAVKASIYGILVALLRHYVHNIVNKPSMEQQRNIHCFKKVLEYVEQHYNEDISLIQLASFANMSNQYFCRIFKSITGKRPMEYINYLRMNKAASLLIDSDLNISEIAMTVGFDDSNYFSRLFKKYKKISPTLFRKGVV